VSPPLAELSQGEVDYEEEDCETKGSEKSSAPSLQDLPPDLSSATAAATAPHSSSVSRQEEIIRGFLRASHIKASLLELLGSSSRSLLSLPRQPSPLIAHRFVSLEDFAGFFLQTLGDSDSSSSSPSQEQLQDIVHTLLKVCLSLSLSSPPLPYPCAPCLLISVQNLSGTKSYLDFIDISLIFLSAEGRGLSHWKHLPSRIVR
jgi:hypothetical protein